MKVCFALLSLAVLVSSVAIVPRDTQQYLLVNPSERASHLCTICVDFVGEFEKLLTKYTDDNEAAKLACAAVTGNNPILVEICKDLVSKYLKEIVEKLDKKEPPKKICDEIKAC